MSYKVTPDDYVEMCKYFESRSDFMKSTMLTVVPWLLAVAAGLIAFAFKEVLAGGKATLSRPAVAYILGMISLVICIIAILVIKELCDHAKTNWVRVDKAKDLLRRDDDSASWEEHPYITLINIDKSDLEVRQQKLTWIFKVMLSAAILHLLAALLIAAASLTVLVVKCVVHCLL